MKTLVIVGGGIAGSLLARSILNTCKHWKVTLIEDPKFKGGGGIQGESVTSTMVQLLREQLGEENTRDWMQYSDATLRVGGKLSGWGKNLSIFRKIFYLNPKLRKLKRFLLSFLHKEKL